VTRGSGARGEGASGLVAAVLDHRHSEWMVDAACAGQPQLPWTTDTAELAPGDADVMAQVCQACPARVPCLAFVAAADVTGGTWVGEDRDPAATALVELATPRGGPVQLGLPGLPGLTPTTRRRPPGHKRRSSVHAELPGINLGGAA
jgi:hypothetical protein